MHIAKTDGSENASSGRLQEFKNNGKLLTVRPKEDGRLPEVWTVRLWQTKFWCFGLAVAYRRWSLTRGGRTWSFDCTCSGRTVKGNFETRESQITFLLSIIIRQHSSSSVYLHLHFIVCLPDFCNYFSALVVQGDHKAKHRFYYSEVEAESFESWYSWFLPFLHQWFMIPTRIFFQIHYSRRILIIYWLNDFLTGNLVSFCMVSSAFKLLLHLFGLGREFF